MLSWGDVRITPAKQIESPARGQDVPAARAGRNNTLLLRPWGLRATSPLPSGPCRAAATGMETARTGGQLLVVLDGMVQDHVVSKPIIFLYRVDQVSAAGPERKFQSTLPTCGPWNTPRILRRAPRPPAPALVSRRHSASWARPRGRAPTCDARVASPVEFF